MPKRKIKTTTARIEEDLIQKANVVAAMREMSAPDYLSGLLRPLIERDYRSEVQKAAKASGKEGESK